MRKRRRRTADDMPREAMPVKLARALDIPEGVLSGFSQISLSGNREAVVEGCAGVLEYDSETVKLSLGKMMVQFAGRGLQIKCMTGESVIVEGYISRLEFLT